MFARARERVRAGMVENILLLVDSGVVPQTEAYLCRTFTTHCQQLSVIEATLLG